MTKPKGKKDRADTLQHELTRRVRTIAAEASGFICPSIDELFRIARLEAPPLTARLLAGHLVGCQRCTSYWSAIQADEHPNGPAMLSLRQKAPPLDEEGRFFAMRAEQHIMSCRRCFGDRRLTDTLLATSLRTPGLAHASSVVEEIRRARASRPRQRSASRAGHDRSTIEAAVLDSHGQPVLRNGRALTAVLPFESGRIDAAGQILIVLDVPPPYQAVQVAVHAEEAAAMLPEVAGNGRVHVSTSTERVGAATTIEPENIWAWVRE